MSAKTICLALTALNGGWMLIDGIHVIIKGKYIGPPEPGPWSKVFTSVGLDPFALGPLFVVFGLTWLLATFSLVMGLKWAWLLTLVIATCTLWYISVGTVISVVVIVLLILFKTQFL